MYFARDPLNDADRLLQSVPESERAMLVVDFSEQDGRPAGVFNNVLKQV